MCNDRLPRRRWEDNRASTRRATATLELAMSLPVLLTLMVAIFWLGFGVAAQTRVTVEARHKAWSQRLDAKNSRPLIFLEDGAVQNSAQERFHVTPLLDSLSQAESRHRVLGGTWDHRQLPMERSPDLPLMALAAANAKTGGIQNALGQIGGLLGQISRDSSNGLAQAQNNRQQNGQAQRDNEANRDREEAKNEAERRKLRQDLQRQVDQLDKQIDDDEKELDRLEEDIAQESDDEKKKSLEDDRDLVKARLERREAERRDLEQQLKGL